MSEIALNGNLGKQIRYFPAAEGKPATAYATLAVDKYELVGHDEAGKPVFSEPETQWHDIAFQGNSATRFHNLFQPGDAIIVSGNQSTKDKVLDNGEVKTQTTVFVKAFGPDAARTKFTIQRAEPAADAEAGRVQQQTQQQQQQQAQVVDAGPAMTPA